VQTPASAVQTWWTATTPWSRQRALGLDPVGPVPGWLAGELAGAGVPLTLGLFPEGLRIARRYVQSPELRAHLAAERVTATAV
jgi:hypothetical protein